MSSPRPRHRVPAAPHAAATDEFVRLWERHADALHAHAMRWARGRRELAEEIVAQARLRAWEHHVRHAGRVDDPGAWLYRVAKNCFHDLLRAMTRGLTALPGSAAPDPPGTAGPQAAEPAQPSHAAATPPGQERSLLDHELRRSVCRAIRHLAPRLRGPLVLQVYGELSGTEIADRLRLNEVTVRKRLQEARQALRPLLGGYLRGGQVPAPAEDGSRRSWAPESVGSEPSGEVEPAAEGFRALSLVVPGGEERDVVLPLRSWAANPERASRAVESYVARHPRGWRRRLDLARLLVQRGDLEAAAAEYRRVLARQPRRREVGLELLRLLAAAGRTAEALALSAAARERSAGREDRLRLEAEEALLLGRPERAADLLGEIAGAGHRRRLAEVALLLARPDAAEAAVAPLLRADPGDPEALLALTDACLAAGRDAEAAAQAARALDRAPSCAPALARLAVLRSAGRDPRDAAGRSTAVLLERLESLAPAAADTAYAHAVWWAERGDPALGRRVLDGLLHRRPGLVRARALAAHWERRYGDDDGAAVPPFLPASDLSGW